MASNGPRYRGHELHDRLVRHANRVSQDSLPENLSGDLLLLRKATVEPVDQDARINESGHARKGPLSSSLGPEAALS